MSAQNNIKEEYTPSTPAWMLTFADLLSLVLTFFVMIYSMTSLPPPKWQQVRSSLTRQLNPAMYWTEVKLSAPKTIQKIHLNNALDLSYLSSILQEKVDDEPTLSGIIIQQQDDRLVISLPHDLLFAPGGSTLTENAIGMMSYLEDILYTISNQIDIYGHTDPTPIRDNSYPSNWELSLVRAVAVAEELKHAGYAYNIKVFGLADSRYQDLETYNHDFGEKKLYQFSRRVDIIVHEVKAAGIKSGS